MGVMFLKRVKIGVFHYMAKKSKDVMSCKEVETWDVGVTKHGVSLA
jgi:hypothetical protein